LSIECAGRKTGDIGWAMACGEDGFFLILLISFLIKEKRNAGPARTKLIIGNNIIKKAAL
jgi:hypothetical protein